MTKILELYNSVFDKLYQYSNDIFLLFIRVYVAEAFFRAGWLKINSWDSTLYLFESEYQVPLIPWEMAAYLGTAAEIILPVFLVLGLASRFVALQLFVFNVVAVISYPTIWDGGYYDHKLWGIMLLVTTLYGAGKIAADTVICKKFCQET